MTRSIAAPSPFASLFPHHGRLISQTVWCPPVPLLHFLRYARGMERFYWESTATDVTFAGVGVAVSYSATGANRYNSLKADFAELYRTAEIEGNAEIGARLVVMRKLGHGWSAGSASTQRPVKIHSGMPSRMATLLSHAFN